MIWIKRILAAIVTMPIWLLPCLIIGIGLLFTYLVKGSLFLMVYAISGE